MAVLDLNRRQFLQLGASAALASQGFASAWARGIGAPTDTTQSTQLDPHLALAWTHGFIDHDLQTWNRSTRLCGVLPQRELGALKTWLGDQGRIQNLFPSNDDLWVTLSLQTPALLRLLEGGAPGFQEHLWGAPWCQPDGVTPALAAPSAPAPGTPPGGDDGAGFSAGARARHRLLVIDHGFPIEHLRQHKVAHIHRVSPHAPSSHPFPFGAYSHGAQVAGLLLQGLHGRGPTPDAPLLLYELPDAIRTSMPHGALWPEIVDAVIWGLSACPRGSEYIVMLSMVSTDADRHPQSFISRCARALSAHALTQGVRLTWVMAAGNSHADRQNLRMIAHAQTPVDLQWHLPSQNFRPSFLACWHDAAMGQPGIQIRPPGGNWSNAMAPLSMATCVHNASGRRQTVFRLPPTAAWAATQALAPSGEWGLRLVYEHTGPIDFHLAMMTSSSASLLRQAHITAASSPPDALASPMTVSGLIPLLPNVVVAQTLSPAVTSSSMVSPDQAQLSAYCGRWPELGDPGDVRTVGFKVDASHANRGALTWSYHGHRIHRVTGTSMAVPLAARGLMGMD